MAFVVIAQWTAREEEASRVLAAIEKLVEPSRAETGNRFYQPSRSVDDPNVFLIYEIYDDEDAYKTHGDSEHFKRWGLGEAIPLLESRERRFYETLG
jgi:quinol monooxygenase YgiN